MDPLTAVLAITRVDGGLLSNVTAHAPWGFGSPVVPGAAFHAITAGTAWLRVAGRPPRHLMPGDVVLFPTGTHHELVSDPGAEAQPFEELMRTRSAGEQGALELPGPGACTRFFCAGYAYDRSVAHPLMSLLPPVLVLAAGEPAVDTAVQDTLRLLAHELRVGAPGSDAVVDRLIDVLFVHVVRAWLASAPEPAAPSWLRALRDPAIAEVLALIHTHPERPWTLDSLAQAVAMSRATLSRRFRQLIGASPLDYLTRWRLDLAAQRLHNTAEPIAAVARSVGYTSPYAFSRAFTRHHGQPPGRYRAQAESGSQPTRQ
jgi:AraC-like DNA-binding protein